MVFNVTFAALGKPASWAFNVSSVVIKE